MVERCRGIVTTKVHGVVGRSLNEACSKEQGQSIAATDLRSKVKW